MAELGYQCEFIDPVPEEFYCKGCKLVARKIRLTNCCEEAYCCACIENVQSKAQPCPSCGEKQVTAFQFKKYRDKVNNLQVYCSMKERGCGWSGTLEQLDTHLDPHQDNCQYVDTECPLNCLKTIPKNKLDDHLAQHCAKRAYVCRHCSFKATYEEVVDTHLPQCKYVPLDCPNRCGVTFERDFLEDHMKICRLEEVECELRGVGCGGRFLREDQEEHARQNSQKHLTLTASLAVETKEQLQQKLLELDQRHEEEEERLKKKIEGNENTIETLKQTVLEQSNALESQALKLDQQKLFQQSMEKKMAELSHQMKLQKKIMELQDKRLQEQKSMLEQMVQRNVEANLQNIKITNFILKRTFKMKDFSVHKVRDVVSSWKTEPTYTHVEGYKFCLGLDANGWGDGLGKYISIDAWAIPGEYDSQLKWPSRAVFTIELVNHAGGKNLSYTSSIVSWSKPRKTHETMAVFGRIAIGSNCYAFLEHSKLGDYLLSDALFIRIAKVDVL